MRIIKAIFLLVLFCLQMTVFTVERAFCSDNLVGIEINGEQKVCVCGHDLVIQYDSSSIAQKPCCSSETIEKSSDTISSSDSSIASCSLSENRASYKYAEVTPFRAKNGVVTFSNPPPSNENRKRLSFFKILKVQ